MKLTAIILTKNEEANLPRCLHSLKFCDQIIVIDDNSKDNTVKIASEMGAEVFVRSLNNNFSNQRNFALDKIKSGWVLFLDADEEVSDKLKVEILNVIEETNISAYFLRRQDIFMGEVLKHGESGNTELLRLGQVGKGKWKRRVHEVWEVKSKGGVLKSPLFHYAHSNLKSLITSLDYFSGLHAIANSEEGKKVSLVKVIFYPPLKFFDNFVLKLGFLDGIYGFIMASFMSFHSYLSWSKQWLRQKSTFKKA